MPQGSRGRVVLVGDAGYSACPAAFADYERTLRPFIAATQTEAVQNLAMLVPRTAEAIAARNAALLGRPASSAQKG